MKPSFREKKKLIQVESLLGICKTITVKDKRFGSGRIKRRVLAFEPSKLSPLGDRKLGTEPEKKIKRHVQTDKSVNFKTSTVKMLLLNWNTYGHPFVKHKLAKSEVITKAIHHLDVLSKKYETREIIHAFENGHKLFSNQSFKFFYVFNKGKISLPEFLKYPQTHWSRFSKDKRFRDFPESWFNECLNGKDYLETRYSNMPQIADEKLLKQVRDMWEQHAHKHKIQCDANSVDFKVDTIKLANNLWKAGVANKHFPDFLLERITERMRNGFIKISNLRYMATPDFINTKVSQEVFRYFHGDVPKWNYDWQKEKIRKIPMQEWRTLK